MGKFKTLNGKTKVGSWLGKVKQSFPDVADVVLDVIMGESPIHAVVEKLRQKTDGVDKKNAESLISSFEFQKSQFEHELGMFELEVDDRKDARTNGDQYLQRVVAWFSLGGFTVFSMINIWLAFEILQNEMVVNEFIIMTTSNMNGIFTGLIFTLKDFLFGGSSDKTN